MTERAPDNSNPDLNPHIGVKEAEVGEFDILAAAAEVESSDQSGIRPSPETITTSDYRKINPSIQGWSIRLDIGEGVDEKTLKDIKTIKTWHTIGVFSVKFEKCGKRLIVHLGHSEDFVEDHFDRTHIEIIGKPSYRAITTASAQCLREPAQSVGAIHATVNYQAKTTIEKEGFSEQVRRIENMEFSRIIVYVSIMRLDSMLPKLKEKAEMEGLICKVTRYGKTIIQIELGKGSQAGKKMIERKHAYYFASLKPVIE